MSEIPGVGAGFGGLFGASGSMSQENLSKAKQGAEDFKAAAKNGDFGIDPDAAKAAIKEFMRAENAMLKGNQRAHVVNQRPPIGSSPYLEQVKDAYKEGGESAVDSMRAFSEVLRLTREGLEEAVKRAESIDDAAADTFDKGM